MDSRPWLESTHITLGYKKKNHKIISEFFKKHQARLLKTKLPQCSHVYLCYSLFHFPACRESALQSRPTSAVTTSPIGPKFSPSANGRSPWCAWWEPSTNQSTGRWLGGQSGARRLFDGLLSLSNRFPTDNSDVFPSSVQRSHIWRQEEDAVKSPAVTHTHKQQCVSPPRSLYSSYLESSQGSGKSRDPVCCSCSPVKALPVPRADLPGILLGDSRRLRTCLLRVQEPLPPGSEDRICGPCGCRMVWQRWPGPYPGWCDPRWPRTTPAVVSLLKVKASRRRQGHHQTVRCWETRQSCLMSLSMKKKKKYSLCVFLFYPKLCPDSLVLKCFTCMVIFNLLLFFFNFMNI